MRAKNTSTSRSVWVKKLLRIAFYAILISAAILVTQSRKQKRTAKITTTKHFLNATKLLVNMKKKTTSLCAWPTPKPKQIQQQQTYVAQIYVYMATFATCCYCCQILASRCHEHCAHFTYALFLLCFFLQFFSRMFCCFSFTAVTDAVCLWFMKK